jgi:polyphenol oxidase
MSAKYHFFGKDCIIDRALSMRSNLNSALQEKNFNVQHVLFVNQIHGGEVVVVDDVKKIYGDQGLPKADALVTNLPNIAIGVITADCAPVLFFDKEKNIVGSAHAGWRGAKIGVLENTVAAMKKLGAKNIEVIIGPMIQQKSYEVSQDFFDDFLNEDLANKSFFINGAEAGKWLFDLPSYVEKKLRDAGVVKINNKRIDTYENEESFFSFRRSGHKGEKDCGRNVSVISPSL